MDIGVSSLILATASPRRSEGEARQHAHTRPHFTPHASVYVEYDRDATHSSFRQTLGFWRQLEEKALVPSVNPANDKPGPTAVVPRKDPGDH
eukprot:2194402-Pleurochrysis_carterae.AAC.1